MSFIELSEPLFISAIKKTQNRNTIIVRLYNPTQISQNGWLKFYKAVDNAWLVNMNEQRKRKINLSGQNIVALKVKAKKIITIEFEMKSNN